MARQSRGQSIVGRLDEEQRAAGCEALTAATSRFGVRPLVFFGGGQITVCLLVFTLRQILKQRLAEQAFAGSFVELVKGLSRVPAVLLDDGNGHRYRLRDEISAGAMPALQALKIVPSRRGERLG
jgi:hypothetical protein